MFRRATAAALLLALAPAVPTLRPAASAQVASEDARLDALFHDSDEAQLKLSPLGALSRGDLRYADRFDDMFSDRGEAAERTQIAGDLAALAKIDRARLSPAHQIAYDSFKSSRETDLRAYDPRVRAIARLLPIDHMNGIQTWYPRFAMADGQAPFKTVADYDNALKRNAQYAVMIDRAIARFRQGMAQRVTEPKLVVRNVIGQLDGLIAEGVEGSTFYTPAKAFPDAVPAADRTRLTAAYAAQVRDVIQPAHRRLRDFLANTYLPAARDSVGLSALPGGDAYYRYRIEAATGLQLDPAALHQLGLDALARDTEAAKALMAEVKFTGTVQQFFDMLRTDKRFQPTSGEQVRAGFADTAQRVMARVPEQFALMPKTRVELKPYPAYLEKGAAPGSYSPGTPDGSRPGTFFYNTYDLPSRYTWQQEDLYLHEAVPGHHFQMSLAQENTALPSFMRFDGNTAFVEGWGLYAEQLGPSLGMMTDPYQRAGMLYGDMVRALRLVCDTGIHAKGWTRDQAIAFEIANAPISQTAATAEVERYIARPGQAVAYKVGQLTILKAREKARAALGSRFDIRAFHAQVLGTGALPLPVLEKKIDDWIAAGGK